MNPRHLNLYNDLNHELERQVVRLHTRLQNAVITRRDWEDVFNIAQTVVALAEALHYIVSVDA